MSDYKTEQEAFWAGEFGDDYVGRNDSEEILSAYLDVFSQILPRTAGVNSVLEFGANVGLNMKALKLLLPNAKLSAIEINEVAVQALNSLKFLDSVYHTSILDFTPDGKRDFVFIKGVLIHLNPEYLDAVYQKIYDSSSKYVCIVEYYNPTPVAIPYRGHNDKLFKRDWAGEMMDKFPDLNLIDYGFLYHRDNAFNHGDSTWFLMEKR